MKKQDANNTFEKGLIMDLNPIVTPTNVVTNCLNGTLLTYNGNENVLQNDMGNGRVETAYLPEGYVPVGTAELGGIIYIVSYNPIISKCQIGCFPSPERNITSDEILNIEKSISDSHFKKDGSIVNTVVRLTLIDDPKYSVLNSGDKYSIYSTNEGIKNNLGKLSDLNSEVQKVDYDPKNVTIHVISIGEDGKISYLDDYLKWNSEYKYFISDHAQAQLTGKKDLDDYRSLVSSSYNVFRGTGQLALLFELKIIDSFSVTWDATVEDINEGEYNKKATIIFNTDWTSSNDSIKPKYLILKDSQCTKGLNSSLAQKTTYSALIDSDKKVKVGTFKYNSNNELIKYIWNYTIMPAMKFGSLDFLANTGSINFQDIGSGKITLKEWRYFIENNSIQLNWGLEAYPEKNKEIKNVIFTFIPFDQIEEDIINNQIYDKFPQYTVGYKKSYSGNFSERLILNEESALISNGRISSNSLYLVDINIIYGISLQTPIKKIGDIGDIGEPVPLTTSIHIYKWLYTTKQWNDVYIEDKIKDFSEELALYDTLTLSPSVKNIEDNIKSITKTNEANLIFDSQPADSGKFTTMGVRTISVNNDRALVDEDGHVYDDVRVSFNIDTNYPELFKFDDDVDYSYEEEESVYQYIEIKYTHEIKKSSISLNGFEVESDKESTVSDVIQSKVMESKNKEFDILPTDFKYTIDNAMYNDITEDINDKLVDSFAVQITEETKIPCIQLGFKGALFSKINSEVMPKSIEVGQKVKPILYNQEDSSKLGLSSVTPTLSVYYKEGHRDLGGGDPFSFKFGEWSYPDGTKPLKEHESTKKEWDKDDSLERETYWDDTAPYTDYLNLWMQDNRCPFQVVQYAGYQNDKKENIYVGDRIMDKNYGLWVKTNNNHYMPINSFWRGTTPLGVISDQIVSLLASIYWVDTNSETIQKCIVDSIHYPRQYTEFWNVEVESKMEVHALDACIRLQEDGLTLYQLQQKLKNLANKINLKNISLSDDPFNLASSSAITYKFKPYTFSHTFKINMEDMYNIYESAKLTRIPSMYYIASKKGINQIGMALNPSNLYVFVPKKEGINDLQNIDKFVKLDMSTSQYLCNYGNVYFDINTQCTIIEPKELPEKLKGCTSVGNLKIANAIMLKDGELCFDEDSLLVNKVKFVYNTKAGKAIYKGNSAYPLLGFSYVTLQ